MLLGKIEVSHKMIQRLKVNSQIIKWLCKTQKDRVIGGLYYIIVN